MPRLDVPTYFLPRPPIPRDPDACARIDELFAKSRLRSDCQEIEYDLGQPKWQFLARMADHHGLLMHGSGKPDIELFEPRQSNDVNAFGDQRAVYAASDGIWPMFFAILDRSIHMSLINSCIRYELGEGRLSKPYYFFSVTDHALPKGPFKEGWVYLLPREGFKEEPPRESYGRKVHLHHWASLEPVEPIAKLRVVPDDFPFLKRIRGHDVESTYARALADPDGFPWLP